MLAYLSLSGNIQIWQIVVLSIILGCINAFDVPSRHSFVIDMVEKKEDLGNAIALNSLMFNGARLIGPSIAGVILASAGEGVCFLLNAISYIFVISSLLMMKLKHKETKSGNSIMIKDLREGLSYTFGFPPIKHLILLLGTVSLMGMSYSVLMPVFAKGDIAWRIPYVWISYGSGRFRCTGWSAFPGFKENSTDAWKDCTVSCNAFRDRTNSSVFFNELLPFFCADGLHRSWNDDAGSLQQYYSADNNR